MNLSDLQNKYVVNVSDGRNIGSIIDVKIDANSGSIISLVLETQKSFFSFGGKENGVEIYWKDITKIGEDIILVNISL